MNVHGSGSRVRIATSTDADRLRALRSHLRQPSEDLLAYGLAVGDVLVSVGGDEHPDDGAPSCPNPARVAPSDPATTVVGYLLPVDAPTRPGCHLAELVVDPAFRRDGRARELVSTVLRGADGPVTLQAHPGNDAALALYESLGFAVVDRRPDAYDDGDALVLRHG